MTKTIGKSLMCGAMTLLVVGSALAATGGAQNSSVTTKTLEYRDKTIDTQDCYNDIYQTTVNGKARVFYNPEYGGGEAKKYRKKWKELTFCSDPWSDEVLAAVCKYEQKIYNWCAANNIPGRSTIACAAEVETTLTEEPPVVCPTSSTLEKTGEEVTDVQTTEFVGEDCFTIGDSQYGNSESIYLAAGQTLLLTEVWIEEFWLQTNNFDVYHNANWQVCGKKIISPLVIPMNGTNKIEASGGTWLPHGRQFYNKKKALFDFYGNGFPVAMEWVGPNDGLLCQPKANGSVDGTCLFGTATGYRHGFEQLSTRDKNRDLAVTGKELDGLCIWQDANGNARVDSGEVKSVQESGITSLSLRHVDFRSDCMMNGKKTALYDWWPTVLELKKVQPKKV